MKTKRGISAAAALLAALAIALATFVLVLIGTYLLSDNSLSWIDWLKDTLRFGT